MKTQPGNIVPLAAALAALGLSLATIQQVKGAGFVSVRPMNRGRNFHTATLLPNGKVLVAGGAQTQSSTSAELYDPVTNTWTLTGALRQARSSHTATLLTNGKVLVAGGASGASAEVYDPATGTWTLTGPMMTRRIVHTATLLPNGKVLAAGGGGEKITSAELYDPATGTWTAAGPINTNVGGPTTLLPNGKVLVAGTADLYDAATGTWTTTGAPSLGYDDTATLLLNGKVLVAGGNRLFTAELYYPDSGTWLPTGSLIWDRDYSTATLLRSGQVLMVSGVKQGPDTAIPSAELYDPTTGTWTEMVMSARFSHTATLLPGGKVLVAGGLSSSFGLLSSAQLYVPDNDGAAPSITILHSSKDVMSFSWTGVGTLEQSDSLTDANWQAAPIQDNPLTVGITGPGKFFRLRFNQ